MDFATAKQRSIELNAAYEAACAAHRGYPRNAIGLTPDDVKFSPAYRATKAAYDKAFAELRSFNDVYCRVFKKELKAERDAIRLARLAKSQSQPNERHLYQGNIKMLRTSYSVEQSGSVFLIVKTVVNEGIASKNTLRANFVSKAHAERMAHSLNSAQHLAANGFSVFFSGD